MMLGLILPILMAAGTCTPTGTGETFFDSNGVKIRYVAAGAGEPVLLIHGWMSDATMWGRDALGNPKLSPPTGFRVIALDCRGHGKSDKPHNSGAYGYEMAADVVRLLDHLKIERAHLIGYSMGAFIAGKVASTHPKRVISVVYGGQAPLLSGEAGSKEIEVMAKGVGDGKGMGPYLRHVRPELTVEQADALAKIMFGGKDIQAWAAAGLSFAGLEVKEDDIRKFPGASLFVYGSKESESTKSRVAALRKRLPLSLERVIEGGDHQSTLGNPAFGAAIIEFLNANLGK